MSFCPFGVDSAFFNELAFKLRFKCRLDGLYCVTLKRMLPPTVVPRLCLPAGV